MISLTSNEAQHALELCDYLTKIAEGGCETVLGPTDAGLAARGLLLIGRLFSEEPSPTPSEPEMA